MIVLEYNHILTVIVDVYEMGTEFSDVGVSGIGGIGIQHYAKELVMAGVAL